MSGSGFLLRGYGISGGRALLSVLGLGLSVALFGGCERGEATPARPELEPGGIQSVPLAERGDTEAEMLFEQMPAERSGIDFVHWWNPKPEYAYQLNTERSGGGVCIGDYDGDGLADVYLTRPFGGARLYRNVGGFRFEDVTEDAGFGGDVAWSVGATFADVNNDGRLDLYVCGFNEPNRLYINQGDGTFTEGAEAYGLDFNGASTMMAFADYDGDGDLDGYLVTNRLIVEKEPPPDYIHHADDSYSIVEGQEELFDFLVWPEDSAHPGRHTMIQAGQHDYLYRNNGDGTFTDVSEEAGITGNYLGLAATWWDYNGDGRPDLYVSNDYYGPDQLLRNNGDGTFTDVIESAVGHTPWFSMGADAADINNDGRLDFMASDMAGTSHYKSKVSMGDMSDAAWFLVFPEPRQVMRNTLYLNTGTGRFIDVAPMAGVASSDWTWSPKFGDLDNDGRVDLLITNGMSRDFNNSDMQQVPVMDLPRKEDANMAFRNRGDLRFEDVSKAWGVDHEGVSFGAAMGDLDSDGDLDLIVSNFEEPVHVYRNTSVGGHRVRVRLIGTESNSHGIGATVRIETGEGPQVRYLSHASGFASSNEPVVHFGVGGEETIDRLEVRWPSGHVQEFHDLAADRLYRIAEPAGAAPTHGSPPDRPGMFQRSDALDGIVHREEPYDDFGDQLLLPNKLSQLGPGMAWGDVNGDGEEDLYAGGAAGQAGMLYLADGDGGFREADAASVEAFAGDRAAEDMAPLFLDADGDGDEDLYVVSGGYEFEPGDEALRDRLYLNDGTGRFTRAEDALPDLRDSGGTAVAADFDRDGDLDLFVGGRVIPGDYPLSPSSRLLRNDGGRFTDVTDELAPGLGRCGMVTSAVWSDADGDGWLDLLVTCEYGPVRLFGNEGGGKFAERTDEAGLADRTGWWNGIAARDIDHDGDIDYVVTNFGLNTKYHPSPEKPQIIYYGDFDNSGKRSIVEAKKYGDTMLPTRGKSCSQDAMPLIGERFPKFHDFASASLSEIYTEECLAEAYRVEANTLDSGVLINDGKGGFTFQPLPRVAQVSPGFGAALTDVDGDGEVDLYLVQNFYHPQAETARMDSGVSQLLRGNGDGTFEPIEPARSGLIVPEDAKGLAAVDFNDDGWVDFAVTVNDGEMIALENRGSQENGMFSVRLRGREGNLAAAGARVTVHLEDGAAQTAEMYAGGGYLSQSSGVLAFGLGESGRVRSIDIRWPDGQTTSHRPEASGRAITIDHP